MDIIKKLRKDEGLRISWQANIAMPFQDEYARCKKKYKNRQDIHKIANKAAEYFINLLTRESK